MRAASGSLLGLLPLFLATSAYAQQVAGPPSAMQNQHAVLSTTVPASNTSGPSTIPWRHQAQPQNYQVQVRALTVGVSLEIWTEDKTFVAQCGQSCWLRLRTGKYAAYEVAAAGKKPRHVTFDVSGPGRIDIDDGNVAAANTGLLLGIGGLALLGVGWSLIAQSICVGEECINERSRTTRGQVGLAIGLTGLLVTPIGWIMYGVNHGPTANYFPMGSLQVALTPNRDGMSLGLQGRF